MMVSVIVCRCVERWLIYSGTTRHGWLLIHSAGELHSCTRKHNARRDSHGSMLRSKVGVLRRTKTADLRRARNERLGKNVIGHGTSGPAISAGESIDQKHAPFANSWDELLGPFYRVSAVAQWAGLSDRVVRYRIATRQLIGLKTSDRTLLLPTFQFNEHGHVPEGLREVLIAMDPDGIDLWGDALLLRERRTELGGHSGIEALTSDRYDQVLAFAHELGRELRNMFPPSLKVSGRPTQVL